MGVNYSYECTKASIAQRLGHYGTKTVLLCDLEFVDDHGRQMAPIRNVVVVVENGHANTERYPENFLPENTSDEERHKYDVLCRDGHPYHDVYNPEELAAMLA